MKNETKNKEIYIKWILESIDKILTYTKWLDFEEFDSNNQVVDACLMQFQHLWETVKKLRELVPEDNSLPYEQIIWFRNYIAHDYVWIELYTVWSTIKYDLPKMKKQVNKLKN